MTHGRHKALKMPRKTLLVMSFHVIELGLPNFKNFAHLGLTLENPNRLQHTVIMLSWWRETSRVEISKLWLEDSMTTPI